ncbi:MAG TPA: Mur ligase family protein [bacterium]|nr:Mur ligase family protein [bacterium]
MRNDFLEKLFKRKGGIKLGLGRVAGAFPSVLEKKIPVYHVAGTNGKGTAVYSIAHILEKNGFRTGRFISPHLFDYNERISVDGVDISDAKVRELYGFLEKNVDGFEELSFFEVTFLMAWKHFELENCDRVVLEVGLGGRLDATNVIDWRKTDIITSIGLDHTHILGDTIEKIASEKLGIVKKDDTVIIGSDISWLKEDALSRGAETVTDENFCGNLEIDRDDLSPHQIKNIKLAVTAVKITEKNIVIPDFSEMVLPGRYQLIEPDVRIDVAHNPPAVRSLVEHIAEKGIRPVVVFGAMKDKDIGSVLDELARIAVEIHVITVEEENRGASADEIILRSSEYVKKIIKKSQNDEKTMKNALLSAHANNTELLVTGSFYTIEKFVKWRKNL